jgi:hypothetical protein
MGQTRRSPLSLRLAVVVVGTTVVRPVVLVVALVRAAQLPTQAAPRRPDRAMPVAPLRRAVLVVVAVLVAREAAQLTATRLETVA